MQKSLETTAKNFAQYHKSAASRLRYEQAQRNLEELHRLSGPLRILDAAGGNGLNTEFLLALGHTVTLLDANPEMLQQAQERMARRNLLERFEMVEGTLEAAPQLLPEGEFDLILCHHVLEYTDASPQILKGFAELAVDRGELSLITLNPVSEVIRAVIFRHDPALARSKLTDRSYDARWFGQATLYPFEQVLEWAQQTGWSLGDFRAIRVLADYMPQEELTDALERELAQLEMDLAGCDPYRSFGRYLQFCLTKSQV